MKKNKVRYGLVVLFIMSISVLCFSAELREGADKVKLENGLTVILKSIRSIPVVSVQVWVKVGSVNENEKTSGLSHFLEHLIFKGTEKYPGQDISRIVETSGGMINAATSKEFTYFYIDTHKDGLEDAVKILADAMENITLPEDELSNERPVVLEEIARHNDNPGVLLYDVFTEALFPDSPYRTSVLGSSDVIKNITRNEIMDYYKTHYVPANMFLVIAGDFDNDRTMDLVKKTFGLLKSKNPPKEPDLGQKVHKGVLITKQKAVEQSYMLSGFLGPDVMSNDQYTADVCSVILGGGRSSRLNRIMREEKQLVYGIGSSYWNQRGTGAMVISASFNKDNNGKIISEIESQINALMTNGPTDDEVKRSKEILKSQWVFGNETCHDKATLSGYWELQGNPGIISGYLDGIEKVTKEDVLQFFRKYYSNYGLSTALITSFTEKK